MLSKSRLPERRAGLKALAMTLSVLLIAGCAGPSLRKDAARDEPSFARPPATSGVLFEMAGDVFDVHGPKHTGFHLLDGSRESLEWRLALIDSAVDSLDIQTYLWYPDNSGRVILERALLAAERGVHVRLIIDDLLTIGLDEGIYIIQNHPNVEFRLFNPWGRRSVLSRAGEMVAEMERLNTRMHNKLLIADGNAAIVGGRNIGDHYFGLSRAYNFHDLDVLGMGHLARQAQDMFDHYWNSEWVVSAANLDQDYDPEVARQKWQLLRARNHSTPDLQSLPLRVKDWRVEFIDLGPELHYGTSDLVYDQASAEAIGQDVALKMFGFMDLAQEELLITNAYIIPGQSGIDFVQGLSDRGVDVKILTNSLASHDVPAVNAHYKGWRDDFILAGADLYEARADAAIQSLVDIPPVAGEFVGLHTKALVVDRDRVFIGSMNFDPRSVNINTESGAFIHSPGLADALAEIMYRDMHPDNAWQVLLDEAGKPYWVNSEERLHRQPARRGSQRVMEKIFKMLPRDQF